MFFVIFILFVPTTLCHNTNCVRSDTIVNCSTAITYTTMSVVSKEYLNRHVEIIDLQNQPLQVIPAEAFTKAYNLLIIDLKYCELKTIHEDAFKNLTKLETLYLEYNYLTELDAYIFRDNWNFMYLYANNNKLIKIENGLFANLTHLKILELHTNEINEIGGNVFKNNHNLEYLSLSDNKITYLDGNILNDLKKLSLLYIQNNLWHCDCNLRSLYQVNLKLFKGYVSPKCYTPLYLQKYKWTDLTEKDFRCPKIRLSIHLDKSQQVILTCQIESNVSSTANWYEDNQDNEDGKQLKSFFSSKEKNKFIYITNVPIEDIRNVSNNTYTCVVSEHNNPRKYEKSITFSLEDLKKKVKEIVIQEGNYIELFCDIENASWFYNNLSVPINNNNSDKYQLATQQKILKIIKASVEDQGLYECFNSEENMAQQFSLTVIKPTDTSDSSNIYTLLSIIFAILILMLLILYIFVIWYYKCRNTVSKDYSTGSTIPLRSTSRIRSQEPDEFIEESPCYNVT